MEVLRNAKKLSSEAREWYPLNRKDSLYAAGLLVAAACYFNNPDAQINAFVRCSPGDEFFRTPHKDVEFRIENIPTNHEGIWLVVASDVNNHDVAFRYIGKGLAGILETVHGGMNASPKVNLRDTEFKNYTYTATVYDGALQEKDPNFSEMKWVASTQFTPDCVK